MALYTAPAVSPGAVTYHRAGVLTEVSARQTGPQSSQTKHPSSTTATGLASYYSKTFDGEKTASGKIFHNDQLVAANRTYPFGTIVRVTRLDDHKTVQVRIIDRGPFGRNRKKGTIIDLSRAAAAKLDMLEDGLVRVRLDVIKWGRAQKAQTGSSLQ